jgi:hypothetical protein
MEGYCSTGQGPQWAVVPMEKKKKSHKLISNKNLNIYICMKFMHHSNQQNTVYNEKKLYKVVFNENLTEECVTLMAGCCFFFRPLVNMFDV